MQWLALRPYTCIMNAATGHPDLDAALQSFWDANELVRAARPSEGRPEVRVQDMLDPQMAVNRCGLVSNMLSRHLREHGFETVVTDDVMRYLAPESLKKAVSLMTGPGPDRIPSPEDHGYADRTVDAATNHCAVLVLAGSDVLLIDMTSSQYGYEQTPLVQRQLPSGAWERDFVRPSLGKEGSAPQLPAQDDTDASLQL